LTLAGVVFLGLLFGWSIWSMRPFQLSVTFRLRTLIALIAIVPLELIGAMAVWNSWERWDAYQWNTAYDAFTSEMKKRPFRPGDVLLVGVSERLPDCSIAGERPVQVDGKINLGYYGAASVAGLTMREAKEQIILHLRGYLDDRQLGLVEFSDCEPLVGPRRISPSESAFVFVDLLRSGENR
jgi:hypothetical protein